MPREIVDYIQRVTDVQVAHLNYSHDVDQAIATARSMIRMINHFLIDKDAKPRSNKCNSLIY